MIEPPPLRIRGIDWKNGVVEDNELVRAYIAGVIDSGSSIRVAVRKDQSYSLGYKIVPSIEVRRKEPELPSLLAQWGDAIGIRSELDESEEYYRWQVNRRDDVKTTLEILEPYLLVYDDAANTILHEIIPRLEKKEHTTKEGFIELMEYVDSVREAVTTRSRTKYDAEHFRELWSDEVAEN